MNTAPKRGGPKKHKIESSDFSEYEILPGSKDKNDAPLGHYSQKIENPVTLTRTQFEKCLPAGIRSRVTDEVINEINGLIMDETEREAFRGNLLSFTSVMAAGKFSLREYVNAVQYVGYKLIGESNLTAFVKVFPERYQNFVDNEWKPTDIASRVSSYHRTRLVSQIMEQALVPSWILNQDKYQAALNVQASLMMDARSEKVRSDAANSLLMHLRQPETQKITLDVAVKENDAIKELKETTLALAAQQRKLLEAGAVTAKEVAEQKIVGEIVSEQ